MTKRHLLIGLLFIGLIGGVIKVLRDEGIDFGLALALAQVLELRTRHGYNELAEAPPVPLWRKFLGQFKVQAAYQASRADGSGGPAVNAGVTGTQQVWGGVTWQATPAAALIASVYHVNANHGGGNANRAGHHHNPLGINMLSGQGLEEPAQPLEHPAFGPGVTFGLPEDLGF